MHSPGKSSSLSLRIKVATKFYCEEDGDDDDNNDHGDESDGDATGDDDDDYSYCVHAIDITQFS